MKFVATFEVSVNINAKSEEVASMLCRNIEEDIHLSVTGCGLKEGCYSYEKKSVALKTIQGINGEKR